VAIYELRNIENHGTLMIIDLRKRT